MICRKLTALFLSAILILLFAACGEKAASGAVAPAISKEGKTIILHTNDSHGRVVGSEQSVGISALKALKDRYKAQGINVVMLDAGDTFHGTAFATLDKGKSVLDLMTMAGYDAMTLGNHDFNYGSDNLVELSFQTSMPMLSTNIIKKGTDKKLLDGYAVIQREDIKIGVFGLSTPETAYKTNPTNVETVEFYNPYTAATEAVSVLKAAEVDYIVALCHLGLNSSSTYTSEGLAKAVAGIDLIVDGHSHTLLEKGKRVGNTLIASAGEYMGAVGVVTLDHATRSATAEVIQVGDSRLQGLSDPAIDAKIQEINVNQQQILSEVLGNTPVDLNGVRADVRTGETNLGDLITDAMCAESGAQIALINGGSIRDSIPAGDITKGNIINVLPFGNYIVTKKINGSNLRTILESAVKALPEENGAFLQVCGLSFTVDAAAPPGGRVKNVMVDGKPLDIASEYIVATNDFLAAGGDDFPILGKSKTLNEFSALDEVLMRHINHLSESGKPFPEAGTRITVLGQAAAPTTSPNLADKPVLTDTTPEQPKAQNKTDASKLEKSDEAEPVAAVPNTEPAASEAAASAKPAVAETTGPDEDGYLYYVVDYDDNIWNIAKEQLGDVNLWDELLEENKDIIKDQDHIYVGQRLRLPKKAG
ncbi:MAG: 5-nucleotidase/2,3-cyclic phosphodiesterase-like hydrolase [Oscillospiraceae bacterium]|jgi:5'-nucleotidase|nr:5-nucleotidase/2,3-cyclic phosphodiesterase-like hydrolase [Oscillospiraceae bacterium]